MPGPVVPAGRGREALGGAAVGVARALLRPGASGPGRGWASAAPAPAARAWGAAELAAAEAASGREMRLGRPRLDCFPSHCHEPGPQQRCWPWVPWHLFPGLSERGPSGQATSAAELYQAMAAHAELFQVIPGHTKPC